MCDCFGDDVFVSDYICDDGLGYGPYKIKCTMWREDGCVVLDFAGTDPQSSGSINFFLNENMIRMFFGIYMIMIFDPQILFNDGYYDLITVRSGRAAAQGGLLLKPVFPAGRSATAPTATRCSPTSPMSPMNLWNAISR